MNQEEEQEPTNRKAFDLEIETEPDTDEIMREAVQAVEAVGSVRRDGELEDESEATGSAAQADEGVDVQAGSDTESSDTEALQLRLKEAEERAMRALADYENFRRRVERERVEYARYAAENALLEFLPVLDNLNRALEAEGDATDLKQGVEMIQRQTVELLGRLNVVAVPSVGERFDPSVHEAVAKAEDSEVDQPTVAEEYQSGYLLHDRLLRPSMVRVALPIERESRAAEAARAEPAETGAETEEANDAGRGDSAGGAEESERES